MEDIEMNNNDEKKLSNEESSSILNNIKNQLQLINKTFLNSINDINQYKPLSEKKGEDDKDSSTINNSMQIDNFEKEKSDFENKINEYNNAINENFEKILDLANNLKNFDEFNDDEETLKKQLEELKEKNKNSNDKLEKQKKAVEIIYNRLKIDNDKNMMNDFNQRNAQNEQMIEDELDFS